MYLLFGTKGMNTANELSSNTKTDSTSKTDSAL